MSQSFQGQGFLSVCAVLGFGYAGELVIVQLSLKWRGNLSECSPNLFSSHRVAGQRKWVRHGVAQCGETEVSSRILPSLCCHWWHHSCSLAHVCLSNLMLQTQEAHTYARRLVETHDHEFLLEAKSGYSSFSHPFIYPGTFC